MSLKELHKIYAKYDSAINPQEKMYTIIAHAIDILMRTTNKIAMQDFPEFVDSIPGGSAVRGTFLPGKIEIDLFCRFRTMNTKILEQFAMHSIKKISEELHGVFDLRYSQNPYGFIRFSIEGTMIDADVVATTYAENEEELRRVLPVSAMARSPFHSIYLRERVKGKEQEIRLLKFWLKQKRCYGRSGITGFLSELLTLNYGSFLGVLKELPSLPVHPLDPFHREPAQLKTLFPHDLIIIIDPVDKQRNAAAGIQGLIGAYTIKRLFAESQHSLVQHSSLFEKVEIPSLNIAIKATFSKKPPNNDDLFLMLAKLATRLHNESQFEQYTINDLYIEPELSMLYLIPDHDTLLKKAKLIVGPPTGIEKAATAFRSKHSECYEKEGRLFAEKPHEFPTLVKLLEHSLAIILEERANVDKTYYLSSYEILPSKEFTEKLAITKYDIK